jgi:tetratricopeptide (TPR) repeat protein
VARLLHQRAEHLCAEHDYEAARSDLARATQLNPSSVEILMLYATTLGLLGLHNEAFFQLCKIQKLNPKTPGLLEEMQKAAACCQRSKSYKESGTGVRQPITEPYML